jgi:hypothetical protein
MKPHFSERLHRAWVRYRDKVEFETSVFPFPNRRKTLFAKLHDDFLMLLILGGLVWLVVKAIIYVVG